uniref:tRNA-dihydrouridine synthase n=1 Tax=Solanum tuberosum TaxID=4113 RepID=M1DIB7_SOLTU
MTRTTIDKHEPSFNARFFEEIGADGVLSADPLLENLALFAGYRTVEWGLGVAGMKEDDKLDQAELLIEYLSFTLSCMFNTFQLLTHTCATSSRDVGLGSQLPGHR